ncbi:MAG: NAD(P)/FAD-dependent oxidoreductase, partial [Proteobacteria bacterium]|nr:NAD(P)/FAD-dependent oxidoreductase [Pseudomonadota bacterium]
MVSREIDAIIIGSGPNGLAAAVALAEAGLLVKVFERADEIGGGTRSAELTLPGFVHDICSAVHPMGVLSPFFRRLPLGDYGLEWIHPPASVAHPFDDRDAAMLYPSLDRTCQELGGGGVGYRRLLGPLLESPHDLLADVLAPLRIPSHPVGMLRSALRAVWSANRLA